MLKKVPQFVIDCLSLSYDRVILDQYGSNITPRTVSRLTPVDSQRNVSYVVRLDEVGLDCIVRSVSDKTKI